MIDGSVIDSEPELWIISIADQRCKDSFIALFGRYAPKLKSYLVRHGAPQQIAEGLCQLKCIAR